MRIVVVIPVYNEAPTLRTLFERLERTPAPVDPETGGVCARIVVLVDDGSSDGTTEIVRDLGEREGVIAVFHERNRGKGAALKTGFGAALEAGAEVVLVQDGDLEYDPGDHAQVLAPILDGRADAVIGSRFLGGGAHRVLYYWHSAGNRLITLASNLMTNLNLTDIECCSKAMTRRVVERIEIREARFGVEPEAVAKLARMRLPDEGRAGAGRRLRIYEVPVSYAGRTYAEGKKIGWRDGVRALWCILKYRIV